jgi:hypothetical protein
MHNNLPRAVPSYMVVSLSGDKFIFMFKCPSVFCHSSFWYSEIVVRSLLHPEYNINPTDISAETVGKAWLD